MRYLGMLGAIFAFAGASFAAATELSVSAAASLTDAFTELAAEYEKVNPNVKIAANFGASRTLLQQIEQGAPVDVFAAADQATMDEGASKKLIVDESRKNFAENGIVLAEPAGKKAVTAIEDLKKDAVTHVALGNPDYVPAGRYAKEILQAAGLWDALREKFILGENVRQVLDYIVRGEVDAGFVFSTDARSAGDKLAVVAELQPGTPVTYPIAVASDSPRKAEGTKFIEYVLSDAGKAILKKYGFR
ncbi:MAG: molybdate ABC transporter substrate-binding protein [Synergistaceae bacterium]|jgi:molybdate transport system substrate-binding protein|nr:molybdate ABC transporter substrate-binding protein [Synergistaceae bacterium]